MVATIAWKPITCCLTKKVNSSGSCPIQPCDTSHSLLSNEEDSGKNLRGLGASELLMALTGWTLNGGGPGAARGLLTPALGDTWKEKYCALPKVQWYS